MGVTTAMIVLSGLIMITIAIDDLSKRPMMAAMRVDEID